jgi:ribosomal protein S18 acetylase RimI-like enzyme
MYSVVAFNMCMVQSLYGNEDMTETDTSFNSKGIRDVPPADFDQLLAIQIDSISSLTGAYPEDALHDWIKYIENETASRYEAFKNRGYTNENNELISFISWTTWNESATIECLYTAFPYRGNQIGRLLLREAEATLKGKTIHVRSTLNAQSFYEKNGYIFTNHSLSRAGLRIALLEKKL